MSERCAQTAHPWLDSRASTCNFASRAKFIISCTRLHKASGPGSVCWHERVGGCTRVPFQRELPFGFLIKRGPFSPPRTA
jgi:hypothetical protein